MPGSRFQKNTAYEWDHILDELAAFGYPHVKRGALVADGAPDRPVFVFLSEDNSHGYTNAYNRAKREVTMEVNSQEPQLNQRIASTSTGDTVGVFYRSRGSHTFTFLGFGRLARTAGFFYTFTCV